METAIKKLNENLIKRFEMIDKIMCSKCFNSYKAEQRFEESLNKKSFLQLKKIYDKLSN